MTKRKSSRIDRKPSEIIDYFLGFSLVVLAVLQIFLANSLSSKGREIGDLDRKKRDLLNGQSLLSGQMASLGSLDRVRADAASLGMIEGQEKFDYLVPPKVAYRP